MPKSKSLVGQKVEMRKTVGPLKKGKRGVVRKLLDGEFYRVVLLGRYGRFGDALRGEFKLANESRS